MQSFKLIVLFLILFLTTISVSAQEYYNKFSLGLNYNMWSPIGNFKSQSMQNSASGMAKPIYGFYFPHFNLSAGYYLNRNWEVQIKMSTAEYYLNNDYIKLRYPDIPDNAKNYDYNNNVAIIGNSGGWLVKHYTVGVSRYFYLDRASINPHIFAGLCQASYSDLGVDTGRYVKSSFLFTQYASQYVAFFKSTKSLTPYVEIGTGIGCDLNKYFSINLNANFGFSQFNFKDASVTIQKENSPEEKHETPFKQDYMNLNISAGIKFRFVSSVWFKQ